MTNNRVTVVVGGQEACTDGETVYLPDQGIWSEADFTVMAGLACHEVGHVWFRSNAFLHTLLKDISPEDRPLVQTCFNAVIDVADETRFIAAMPKADELFASLHAAALQGALDRGACPQCPPVGPSCPAQVLSVAFLLVRSAPRSGIRKGLRGWRTRVPTVGKAFRILKRACDRGCNAGFSPERSDADWRRIGKLVQELVDLMKQCFPSSSLAPATTGPATFDALAQWFEQAIQAALQRALSTLPGGPQELGGLTNDCRDPVRERADEAVEDRADDDDDDDDDEDDDDADDDWWPFRFRGDDDNSVEFDDACYLHVSPAFRQMARSLATVPSVFFENGHASGCRLSRPDRALLDGKCFQRRVVDEGNEAAIALLFDQSHSTESILKDFLPVGLALADALSLVPGVAVSLWRFGSTVERLKQNHDLKAARLMGGTATHLAFAEAYRWLALESAERKIVVLFTDGTPDDGPATVKQTQQLRRIHAQLLVGSIGIGLTACARAMPGAVVFDASPNFAASALLVALKRMQTLC